MRLTLAFLLGIVFILGSLQESSAAIYKYVDGDGLVTFADDIQSIPEQFRPSATIVSGAAGEEKGPAQINGPSPLSEAEPGDGVPSPEKQAAPDGRGGIPFGRRLLISVIVIVSALFAFTILGILDQDHKKSVKIARMVILWCMSVYLLYAHAMDVAHLLGLAGKKVVNVHRESAEKGRKTADKIKQFNAFMDQLDKNGSTDPPQADPGNEPR